VRPGASYRGSLALLARVKQVAPRTFTKSGLMLGLGEEREEVLSLLDDLRGADVDFVTIGQYLRPSPRHAPVARWWTPEEFAELGAAAHAKGFLMVASSPMTRSSYHAERDFERLRARRSAVAAADLGDD
jgi:lipoic acid synthetase